MEIVSISTIPFHCINIVLIIDDDLTVVKTTVSRKELSDMRDISLIFTTKNKTESLPEIDNQVILKTVVHLPFAREGRRNASMTTNRQILIMTKEKDVSVHLLFTLHTRKRDVTVDLLKESSAFIPTSSLELSDKQCLLT